MLPAGITARIAYSPNAAGSNAGDKASSGMSVSPEDSSLEFTVQATEDLHGVAGLTVTVGMSEIEQDATVSAISGDIEEQTFAIRYATGAFTLGYHYQSRTLVTQLVLGQT